MLASTTSLPPVKISGVTRPASPRPVGPARALVKEAPIAADRQVQAPVVDAAGFLNPSCHGTLPPAEVAAAIRAAVEGVGTFQLVNHGVNLELISNMQRLAREFFALPLDTKLQAKRGEDNPNGFFNDEYTKQVLDIKECFDFCNQNVSTRSTSSPVLTAPNRWPEGQPEFRAGLEAYFAEMTRVSFKLLEAFSLGLGLPADTLHPTFQEDHTSFMRLNYYPATPATENKLGLNHHTDAGFLTILIQDPEVHGLQFYKNGRWNDVTPAPDALTINVGDQCQVLTNDIIQAPLHRVLSPHNRARLSAPFFFNPRPEAVIAPLPAFVTQERPAVYNPIAWERFRSLRYAGDFQDGGEEVQIHHFKK